MILVTSKEFDRRYARLPSVIQVRAAQQFDRLLRDPRHPSLQIRKLRRDSTGETWYGRVTDDYRFTFRIERDAYHLLDIGKHDEVL